MTNLETAPAATLTETEQKSDTTKDTQCPSCLHAVSSHDPIALRYCAATQRGALDRGCICHPDTNARSFR
jgi:hypothetical protein